MATASSPSPTPPTCATTPDAKSLDGSYKQADRSSSSEHAHPHLAKGPSAVAWSKMDIVVLPVVTMMYFLSSLDRTNIGNARIAGLQQQLHMTNDQYSFSLTLALIPYILVEIPSNNLMMRVGPRFILPTMVTFWGIACTLQGVVHNYSGLLACRFFLGMFEGGLLPGIFFYLASFYPRRMLQLRIAVMFSATSLASAFSGLLAAAILNMDGIGGRPGWAWIFILEGLFSVLFGISSFFLLPNSPKEVKTLNDEERELISRALLLDGISEMGKTSENRSWSGFRRTFVQPHVILLVIVGFFSGTTLFSLAYYLPSIVASIGFKGTKAQLMSVPPFAVSTVLSLITAVWADRYAHRGATIIFFSLVSLTGFAMFLGSFNNHVRYGSLFLSVTGTYCIAPPLGTWIANNMAPLIRRATSLALFTVMTNLGGILSTWLLAALSPAPRYTSATVTLLVFQAGIFVLAIVTRVYLARENARKERMRAESAEEDPVVRAAASATSTLTAVEVPNESIWFKYML